MLIERAPVPMSKVFFANSGSEANDTAIKMAWYYNNALGRPAKKKMIGRIKGYHGITLAAASLTGLPNNHRSFDLPLPGFIHTMTPHHYHGADPGETEEAFATRCAEALDDSSSSPKVPTPSPPSSPSPSWAPAASSSRRAPTSRRSRQSAQARRAVHRRRGHLRLRAHRQLLGFADLRPAARHPHLREGAQSSSFLPISAVMVNERVFQALASESHTIGTFGHGYTYSGHPVPAAVAIETLKIYDEIDLVEPGPHHRSAPYAERTAPPVRGPRPGRRDPWRSGMIGAMELVADRATHKQLRPGR